MIISTPLRSYLPARNKQEHAFIFAFLVVAPFFGYALHLVHLPMGDLTTIFYPVTKNLLHPYSIDGYINPPWAVLLIAPLSFIPCEFGRILISLLNMLLTGLIVLKYGGGKSALLITFTSYSFLFLLSTGSIEWMPMLGLLFNWPILILAKPQSGALVLLVWLKQTKDKFIFVLSIAAFIALSLWVWWDWPLLMFENIHTLPASLSSPLNKINLWPWGVPFGLVTLYFAVKRTDEFLAIVATWLIAPHLVFHSLTMGMALLAARYPWIALVTSITLYAFVLARWHFT